MKRALLTLLCACSAGSAAPPERTTQHARPAPSERAEPVERPVAAAPGPSIYDLPVQLVDQDARAIGLDVARGKLVLVSMFYASCSIACPLLVSEVDQILGELPANTEVEVLLVSFDAERDTPAKLRELARERKLDARWTLAVASDADARALAAVLGVKYRKLANGEFAHGSTIVALDREGRPVGRTDALGQRDPVVTALAAQ